MILFLDFDGVLHPEQEGRELFCKRPLLWEILRARPQIEVVFSTSWRESHPFEALVDFATAHGGEDLASRFVGTNPVLGKDHRDHYRHRERECLAWLAENELRYPIARRPLPWLALDDVAYWFAIPCWQLYTVDHRTGLTPADVSAILRRIPEGSGPS